MRTPAAVLRARLARILEWGQRLPYADAGVEMWDRDRRMAGNVLAAGLAFRFFVFLLPGALLYSAAVGWATAAQRTAISSGQDFGALAALASVVASSSQEAHRARWALLVLGVVLLVYAGWGASRALVVVHLVAWGIRSRTRVMNLVLATAGLIAILVLSAAGSAIRHRAGGFGVAVSLAMALVYGGLWYGISRALPHRPGPWTLLVPGAILVGAGEEALHLLNTFYLGPRLAHSSRLYGALGTASTILFVLFLFARLIVASPVVNHGYWRRLNPDAAEQPGQATAPAGATIRPGPGDDPSS